MTDHIFETIENKRLCIPCLRPASEALRSRRACPGIPWYKDGQAPANLFTRNQFKASGLQPAPGQQPAGIIISAMYHVVVWLYDSTHAQPRRADTPTCKTARAATWAKTAEKWQCEHCARKW